MWHRGSNIPGEDSGDIDGDFFIQHQNPVADVRRASFNSTHVRQQARNTEPGISVGDHNVKISGNRLKKYKGVTPCKKYKGVTPCKKYKNVSHSTSKRIAQVSCKSDDGTKKMVYLGTFATAEMAAIARDVAVLHLKGESSAIRLNFPHYVSNMKSILQDCSPLEATDDVKFVARKAATALAPLISLENKDAGLEASVAMSAAISSATATSPLMISSNTEHKEPADLVDEDVIFNLPNLLMHMAEGMLLPPPLPPPSPPYEEDDVGFKGISFLWNF